MLPSRYQDTNLNALSSLRSNKTNNLLVGRVRVVVLSFLFVLRLHRCGSLLVTLIHYPQNRSKQVTLFLPPVCSLDACLFGLLWGI
jgi:hypothetical protein